MADTRNEKIVPIDFTERTITIGDIRSEADDLHMDIQDIAKIYLNRITNGGINRVFDEKFFEEIVKLAE